MSSRRRMLLIRVAVLAGLCAVASAARIAQDDVSSSDYPPGQDHTPAIVLPLAPWLQNLNKTVPAAPCIVLESARWGLGSALNNVLWATAIIRQQQPDITVYYDHTISPYQCSDERTLEPVLRPGNKLLKTSEPPANCVRLPFHLYLMPTLTLLQRGLGGLISEQGGVYQAPITSFQQSIDQHMLLDAMFQAMCPIVADFWHLAPDLQVRANQVKLQLQHKQRPVIAIHARGGDKRSELGKYVDPETGQYPMLKGMQRLVAAHPGILLSRPVCLLFGDDYKYAQKVRKMAKDSLNCSKTILRVSESKKSGYSDRKFRRLSKDGRCQATGDYLVDIELMGWSTFFIANHRANAGTTAMFLRKCKHFYDYTSTVPGTGAPRFTLWGG